MPLFTQKQIGTLHTILVDYSYNPRAGADVQAELKLVCEDLNDYCLHEKWDALPELYRSAWQGELYRRLDLIIQNPQVVLFSGRSGDKTQADFLELLSDGGSSVRQIAFSQYTVNRHFQGNYKGQPEWLSETDIHPAARILRSHPDRSSSLRIRLHYQSGLWMCLNNRGFALHCLANLVPRRLAFDTNLKGEEEGRSSVQRDEFKRLNFKRAVPSSRRGIDCMDKTIPTQVTAVPITVNDSDVLYTVQAIGMDPNAAPDNGNETVFNSPEFPKDR